MGLDKLEREKLEAFCVCTEKVSKCACIDCAACRIYKDLPMLGDWQLVDGAWENRQRQLNEQQDVASRRRIAELTAEAEAGGKADKIKGGGKTDKATEKGKSRLSRAFRLRKDL